MLQSILFVCSSNPEKSFLRFILGIITHYVVLRDGQERYRGDENTFTDVGGIGPFQEFVYQLKACNQAGCTDSTKVRQTYLSNLYKGS